MARTSRPGGTWALRVPGDPSTNNDTGRRGGDAGEMVTRSRQDRSRDAVFFHGPRFHTIKDITWKPLGHFASGESRAVTVVGWGRLLEAPEALSLQRAHGWSIDDGTAASHPHEIELTLLEHSGSCSFWAISSVHSTPWAQRGGGSPGTPAEAARYLMNWSRSDISCVSPRCHHRGFTAASHPTSRFNLAETSPGHPRSAMDQALHCPGISGVLMAAGTEAGPLGGGWPTFHPPRCPVGKRTDAVPSRINEFRSGLRQSLGPAGASVEGLAGMPRRLIPVNVEGRRVRNGLGHGRRAANRHGTSGRGDHGRLASV